MYEADVLHSLDLLYRVFEFLSSLCARARGESKDAPETTAVLRGQSSILTGI